MRHFFSLASVQYKGFVTLWFWHFPANGLKSWFVLGSSFHCFCRAGLCLLRHSSKEYVLSRQRGKKMEPCTKWSIKTGTQRKPYRKTAKPVFLYFCRGLEFVISEVWIEGGLCYSLWFWADNYVITQLKVASVLPGKSMLYGFPILNKEFPICSNIFKPLISFLHL